MGERRSPPAPPPARGTSSGYRAPPDRPCVIYTVANRLIGLEPSSGSQRWEKVIDSTGPELYFLRALGDVFVCGTMAKVLRVSTIDGQIIWETDTGTRGQTTMSLQGSRLVLGRRGVVLALDAASGDVAWIHRSERYGDVSPFRVMSADFGPELNRPRPIQHADAAPPPPPDQFR